MSKIDNGTLSMLDTFIKNEIKGVLQHRNGNRPGWKAELDDLDLLFEDEYSSINSSFSSEQHYILEVFIIHNNKKYVIECYDFITNMR